MKLTSGTLTHINHGGGQSLDFNAGPRFNPNTFIVDSSSSGI